VKVAQWSNHEWKKNAFVLKFDKACSAAMVHGKSVIDILYEPHERKCPLPQVRTASLIITRSSILEAGIPYLSHALTE